MKLRNKATGEIVIASMSTSCGEIVFRYHPLDNADDINFKKYRSISRLNEEWEDYEEPKYEDQRIMVDRKQWKKLLNRVKCLERDNESLKKRVKNTNKRMSARRTTNGSRRN